MICYVLNLEHHRTRLQAFLQQFDRSDLRGTELRRFRAIDAARVWAQARVLVYAPARARLAAVERRGFRQTHAELPSRGGVGCALSHLCMWLDILDDAAVPDHRPYLVMEDDVSIPRHLLTAMQQAQQDVPTGWDLLLLGRIIPQARLVTKHTTYLAMGVFWGTYAYLIHKATVRTIFEHGALPVRVQIDAFLSGLAQAKKLTIYAVRKSLVGANRQRWESSIQLDYAFEYAHATLTYDHPFAMAAGPTSIEDLQRLHALRMQCGVVRLR